MDADDAMASLRSEFALNEGEIYLDGNSLGPVSHAVRRRVLDVLDTEWAKGQVRSWGDAGWMGEPTRLGDRIAR